MMSDSGKDGSDSSTDEDDDEVSFLFMYKFYTIN